VSGSAIAGVHHAERLADERLEELVFRVASGALADAGVERDLLDSVTLAASDERDGRSISSMLTSAPAGGLYKEVTKVTDGSLHALSLAAMKIESGKSEAHLVVSWDIASEVGDEHVVAATALEPFVERPVGAIDPIATALLAAAYLSETGQTVEALDRRAQAKDRAAGTAARPSEWVAHPLRASHLAPERDGAVAVLLVSDAFVAEHGLTPPARLAGTGWRTDTYGPAERQRPVWAPLRSATEDALARAGTDLDAIDSFEMDDPNVFAEAMAAEGVGLAPPGEGLAFLTDGGDPFHRRADDGFLGMPSMCSGLWRVAQLVHDDAPGRSIVHQGIGRAEQGHAVAVVERGGVAA
jgi:acetyl-CoA acetyltransferase